MGLARGRGERGGGFEILAENCWEGVLSPGERRPDFVNMLAPPPKSGPMLCPCLHHDLLCPCLHH